MVGNPQKITIITSSDFPYGKSGENFMRNIAKGMHYHDTEVNVIRYRGDIYNKNNDTRIKRGNYLFNKFPKNSILKTFAIIINILYTPIFIFYRKVVKKDKVLIIFGLKYAYELFPILFLSRLFKISIYQIIADYYTPNEVVPIWWKKPKYFFYKVQRKYLDKYFNGLIVLSQALFKQSVKNNVKKNKLLIIPHFIDFKMPKKEFSPNEKHIICFCGAVTIPNGIMDLIKAYNLIKKDLPNSELRIVGEKSPAFESLMTKSNVDTRNIIFTGFLDKNEVEQELYKSSILINPRQKSNWADAGFPTKIGEYFATKSPVISTRVGDLINYLEDKHNIVFATPNNPESLAEAIQFLFKNNKVAQSIGQEGYNWAKSNLEYRQNSKKVLEFIAKN